MVAKITHFCYIMAMFKTLKKINETVELIVLGARIGKIVLLAEQKFLGYKLRTCRAIPIHHRASHAVPTKNDMVSPR